MVFQKCELLKLRDYLTIANDYRYTGFCNVIFKKDLEAVEQSRYFIVIDTYREDKVTCMKYEYLVLLCSMSGCIYTFCRSYLTNYIDYRTGVKIVFEYPMTPTSPADPFYSFINFKVNK